jgi:hypothetical protein
MQQVEQVRRVQNFPLLPWEGDCQCKSPDAPDVQWYSLMIFDVRVSFLRIMRYVFVRGSIGVRVVGNRI